jgi:hypothetical protein
MIEDILFDLGGHIGSGLDEMLSNRDIPINFSAEDIQREINEAERMLSKFYSDPNKYSKSIARFEEKIANLRAKKDAVASGGGGGRPPRGDNFALPIDNYEKERADIKRYFSANAVKSILKTPEDELYAAMGVRLLNSMGKKLDNYESESSSEERLRRLTRFGQNQEGSGGDERPPRPPFYNNDYESRLRARKESLEKEIGIKIDVDTYANSAPLALFESDDVINAFRDAARKIPVSSTYLGAIVFRDLPEGIAGGYLRDDNIVYLLPNTSRNFLVNGGLHHEYAHAKLAEFGDPREVISAVPMEFRDAISESYEEVAAHMLASRFVSKDQYSQMVKDKYKLHSEKDAEDYILSCLTEDFEVGSVSYRRIDKIAEAIAVFNFVDKDISRGLLKTLQRGRVKLGDYEMQAITDLASVYSSINIGDNRGYESGMIQSARMLTKGWRI